MERVLVLGACGAGKSTLATKLGELHGLPVIHLDRHFWQAGWLPPEPAEWARRVEELTAGERWIMDGNYGGTMALRLAQADGAIFLDYPRHVFFPRVVKRTLLQLGRTRRDMADGCAERVDLAFWRYAWRYRIDALPRHLGRVEAAGVPLLRFRSPRETEVWIAAGAPLDRARVC